MVAFFLRRLLHWMMPTDTGRRMLSLQALLNPASPSHSVTCFRQSETVLATESTSLSTEAQTATDVPPAPEIQPSASIISMAKPKPPGPINFAPFEEIDQASYREMCRFRVSPFGKIRQSCQHIPYNSSKKDFFEKTGRESIEGKGVSSLPRRDNRSGHCWNEITEPDDSLQIRIPLARQGQDLYRHVGLQRRPCSHDSILQMSGVYKGKVQIMPSVCRALLIFPSNHQQTTPAQMLSHNPGLREISPSITGGAVLAQGKSRKSFSSRDWSLTKALSSHYRILDALPLCQSGMCDFLSTDCRRTDSPLWPFVSFRVCACGFQLYALQKHGDWPANHTRRNQRGREISPRAEWRDYQGRWRTRRLSSSRKLYVASQAGEPNHYTGAHIADDATPFFFLGNSQWIGDK